VGSALPEETRNPDFREISQCFNMDYQLKKKKKKKKNLGSPVCYLSFND